MMRRSAMNVDAAAIDVRRAGGYLGGFSAGTGRNMHRAEAGKMDNVVMWLATGLGTGLSPWASGTVGSLLGLPLAWWLLGRTRRAQVAVTLVLLLAAVPVCHLAEQSLGAKDDGRIVLDEIVAFPVAVLGQTAARQPWVMASAFVVYRLFDATKPPPIHLAELVPGGAGIVLDDVLAALVSWLVVAGGLILWRRRQAS
ncbi:MAG: phosphatidylglycerophosphatase A [Halomonas sp.]|uniref:phosphatidylglycerophosphatase A family protein n=1 Tax=Halomonas sp. TaxID=1486246 RepID=UPI002ACE207B|nr:phosphatidylglycerophosphatase A [Halomonas sp.]MDZ7852046.1 phosphatidylglycerophosphatase A [Halomonas sp.]